MKKLIGDRQFYKKVMLVAVPIMVQNGITNFVNMLDNIMVGQIGTEQMTGVSIVNQLIFVINLAFFGALSGAGILGAQYYGNEDHKGLRDTFRFKCIICAIILAIGMAVLIVLQEPLIALYLKGDGGSASAAATMIYGKKYLRIMLLQLPTFALVQIYSSTLRETSETIKPMQAGILAVVINLVGNYLLIFGKLGFPKMGVEGAALATVISHLAECIYLVAWTHRNKARNRFIQGAYRSFRIPGSVALEIIKKGTPLLANEVLWASGITFLLQCYSVRGLSVVAAMNISSTISHVFNVVFMAMGNAAAIMVGQLLGAGKMQEAKETALRLITFSTVSCMVVGLALAGVSPLFPRIYNTTDEVRCLATIFIIIAGISMPIQAVMNCSYFILRSGGKTVITFLFDSVFVWVVSIPIAYSLAHFTGLDVRLIYLIVCMADLIKCVLGIALVNKGVWMNRIIMDQE